MNRALHIGLVYLVLSILWIVLTDALVVSLQLDPAVGGRIQTIKGVAFVVLSAALVTALAWRELASSRETERYFEASPDLIAILDPDRRVSRLNGPWREIVGTGDPELQRAWMDRLVHPDDRARVEETLGRVEAGEPIRGFACRLRRTDGEWRWYEWSLVPAGRQLYAAGRDVTDREALRVALSLSEERYRRVFEASPLPTWIFDRETLAFLAVNDAAVRRYGWSRQEFLGMTIADIRPQRDRRRLEASVAATPEEGMHTAGTWRHVTRDGQIIRVEVTSHRISFLGREAELVVANDVTDRIEAENQLRQAQRMESVGRLAGGVAHDFNNLLTIIGNLTGLAEEGLPPDSPVRGYLEEVQAAQRRGAALTRQLLTFSRQESPDAAEPVDLTRALAEISRLFGPLLGRQIRAELDMPEDPVVVVIPVVRLEQVVMNLAVNARDAMPHGGEFHVTLRTEPGTGGGLGQAVLTVRDTGPGVPAQLADRIFDPFFTTKPAYQGTGLGLSTAYGIVSAAGGSLRLTSGEGEGAVFEVRLPLSDEVPSGPAAAPPEDSVDPAAARPARVILVEDEIPLQQALSLGLERRGFQVSTESDGLEALHAIQSWEGPLDILVTDMILPGLDGRALVQEARRIRPGLPVLVISGYAGNQPEVVEFLAQEHFLAKPFTLQELADTVQRILAGAA